MHVLFAIYEYTFPSSVAEAYCDQFVSIKRNFYFVEKYNASKNAYYK